MSEKSRAPIHAQCWFRNVRVYRLTKDFDWDSDALNNALSKAPFSPCGAQDTERMGWVPPVGVPGQGRYTWTSGNAHLVCLRREEKLLPPAVVGEETDLRIEAAENEQGHPLRRKEKAEIKEQVTLELLPKAFTRSKYTSAYIDLSQGLVIVDGASSAEAETLLSQLRETLGTMPVRPPAVNQSPAFTMTRWLRGDIQPPEGMICANEAELRDEGDEGGVIRIKGVDLSGEEIRHHIDNGMVVTRLALHWKGQMAFVLDDELTLRRIHFGDEIKERLDEQADDDRLARFDSAFSLMVMEMENLVPALFSAFGGEDTSALSANQNDSNGID